MALPPLSAVGPPGISASAPTPRVGQGGEQFRAALAGQPTRPVAPAGPPPHAATTHPSTAQSAPAGSRHVAGAASPRPAEAARLVSGAQMLGEVTAAQTRMDAVLALARSGRTFSPAELLALQAQVYRASQELDLAGKVVEKATGGVKQVLQTQV